ncbi:alpha/beta fold hydrolase [Massilia solisilvae]|uniref:Alpha/beta fold hydrolase n=1 Tax=Massilia solisilvae TaxID=1811225 RepID=A0ABT2BHQ3_9BURK|nr:alpha/beta hydrolase [Massilia solisilvae]MCS0608037.1 alpha/beta fold hydrolase [Massilia solisilvae]
MPTLTANGIRLAFDTTGDPKAVPLLLIHGIGMQLTAWPEEYVDGLAELGFYVIRFDNRDCGLSTKFEQAGTPNLMLSWLKTKIGWPISLAYTIDDMAEDAVGVLSALGVARAHVVGVSMGGVIGQLLAARHPGRVLSLTSIMSSSGRRGLPEPSREVRKVVQQALAKPPDFDTAVEQSIAVLRKIGSPAYPTTEKQLRRRVARQLRRNCCPGGAARQWLAVTAAGERRDLLAQVKSPTLVIHGAADPLLALAHGIDTAQLIPGARLEIIEGMGHDLPAQLAERILALIDEHAHGKMAPDSTPRLFVKQ